MILKQEICTYSIRSVKIRIVLASSNQEMLFGQENFTVSVQKLLATYKIPEGSFHKLGIIRIENCKLYLYLDLTQIQEAILTLDNVRILGKLYVYVETSSIIW